MESPPFKRLVSMVELEGAALTGGAARAFRPGETQFDGGASASSPNWEKISDLDFASCSASEENDGEAWSLRLCPHSQ